MCNRIFSLHSRQKVAQFLVDLGRVRHGLGHLQAQELAVAAAQARHGHPGRLLAQAETDGDIRVGKPIGFTGQKRAQRVSQSG